MDDEQLQGFVRRIDPDEATDVLDYADESVREAVLRRLDEDRRERPEFLLEFSPESAAGMMRLDYVTVDAGRPFADVAARVRRHEERTGRFPVVFVTDGEELLGELPGHTLATEERESGAPADYVRETPAVRYDRPDTEVLAVFRANPKSKVAVIATVFAPAYGVALGLVIGVSMVANLVIAGFFGALIPLMLGFFVFLGLAQAVLL